MLKVAIEYQFEIVAKLKMVKNHREKQGLVQDQAVRSSPRTRPDQDQTKLGN